MAAKRLGGLGRGLGALIPTGPVDDADDLAVEPDVTPSPSPSVDDSTTSSAPPPIVQAPAMNGHDSPAGVMPVPGARFAEIEIAQITANPKQPRQVFDEEALAELAFSIREFGVLQPVVVREVGGRFELIMGERRLRAAQVAGLTAIPAIVRDTADDAMLRDALLENIHRAALNPLEEAAAYQQLLEEFGTTHEELASRIGRSRSQVSNTIRLLNLPVAVQRRVAAGVLSAGHARALLGLADREQQEDLATRIVAEGLSVRATEELVALAAKAGPAGPASRTRTTPRLIRARRDRPRRQALGCVRHSGPSRTRPTQRQDHSRVRLGR